MTTLLFFGLSSPAALLPSLPLQNVPGPYLAHFLCGEFFDLINHAPILPHWLRPGLICTWYIYSIYSLVWIVLEQGDWRHVHDYFSGIMKEDGKSLLEIDFTLPKCDARPLNYIAAAKRLSYR